MNRLLFIARSEYLRQITRRGFLMTAFGTPLIIGAVYALLLFLSVVFILLSPTEEVVGYVDHAAVVRENLDLEAPSLPEWYQYPSFRPYADEAAARAAFVAGTIDAYVVVPSNYLETGTVTVYGERRLSPIGKASLRTLVYESLLVNDAPAVRELASVPLRNLARRTVVPTPSPVVRAEGDTAPITATAALSPAHSTGRSSDTAASAARRTALPGSSSSLVAMLFGMMFMGTVFSSSGYLLQALIDEKENRTIEIIVTSVTPEQLIGGKALGLGGVGLTLAGIQAGYLVVPGSVAFLLFEPFRSAVLTFIGQAIPLSVLLLLPLLFVLTYLLYASLIITIGAIVTSPQEGQQMASFVFLPGLLPALLAELIRSDPNGFMAVGLSLFPLTTPVTLLIRLLVGQVPFWQVGLSLGILVVSIVLLLRVAAWLFRLGMLRYDKSVKVLDLLRQVRGWRW